MGIIPMVSWYEWCGSNFTSIFLTWWVIKWKHFPHYLPFVWGIHRSPVNSPHKGQWCGALMFSLIWAWLNGWVNIDLRCHRAHYDITVMRNWHLEYFLWNWSYVSVIKPRGWAVKNDINNFNLSAVQLKGLQWWNIMEGKFAQPSPSRLLPPSYPSFSSFLPTLLWTPRARISLPSASAHLSQFGSSCNSPHPTQTQAVAPGKITNWFMDWLHDYLNIFNGFGSWR